MENMLHIGTKLDKDTSDNAADALCKVLKACYDTRSTDEVTLAVLSALKAVLSVQNVSINNCNFDNDQSKTVEVAIPSDYTLKTK